jgi:2-methylcitrate dehydratase PrpD
LCGILSSARFEDLPPRAVREARRGILDWLGCVLAGSHHPAIDGLLRALQQTGGAPIATVFARDCKLGLLEAPLVNGQMGHVLDFDDTHAGGVLLHTSSPVLAALFAMAERVPVSGAQFMLAYAAGFEAGVRVGRAAPDHHAGGWHLTGTLGSIAAGIAAGKLISLKKQSLTYALGVAATQAGGLQQNRGTMCKSLHAGKAAANGVLAALLAEQGFDSSTEVIEGAKGFARIYSRTADVEQLTRDLGEPWLIESNGHKPYACGLVVHAAIDAVLALRGKINTTGDAVDEILLHVHPLVLSITGVKEPATGLQSKFSVYHSAAVAFAEGAAGIAQYDDARANDPGLIALRRKVKVIADASLREDEARAAIVTSDQREVAHVPHASGTAANPMSDDALEAKFLANAVPVIGDARARQVCAFVNGLEQVSDMRALIDVLR